MEAMSRAGSFFQAIHEAWPAHATKNQKKIRSFSRNVVSQDKWTEQYETVPTIMGSIQACLALFRKGVFRGALLTQGSSLPGTWVAVLKQLATTKDKSKETKIDRESTSEPGWELKHTVSALFKSFKTEGITEYLGPVGFSEICLESQMSTSACEEHTWISDGQLLRDSVVSCSLFCFLPFSFSFSPISVP